MHCPLKHLVYCSQTVQIMTTDFSDQSECHVYKNMRTHIYLYILVFTLHDYIVVGYCGFNSKHVGIVVYMLHH